MAARHTEGIGHFDYWLKDVAPTAELRRWLGSFPLAATEFRLRYFQELDSRPQAWKAILNAGTPGYVTLLYAARDTEHNNAVALRAYLVRRAPRLPVVPTILMHARCVGCMSPISWAEGLRSPRRTIIAAPRFRLNEGSRTRRNADDGAKALISPFGDTRSSEALSLRGVTRRGSL